MGMMVLMAGLEPAWKCLYFKIFWPESQLKSQQRQLVNWGAGNLNVLVSLLHLFNSRVNLRVERFCVEIEAVFVPK